MWGSAEGPPVVNLGAPYMATRLQVDIMWGVKGTGYFSVAFLFPPEISFPHASYPPRTSLGLRISCHQSQNGYLIDPLPIPLPADWNHLIETPLSLQELSRIRTCVNRQAPFGSLDWQTTIAKLLGLVSSLTPRGRPRKIQEK
jgi:hypothetical protein